MCINHILLKVPVVKLNNGLNAPDYKCRYIREDVTYGLLVTKSLADLVDVEVPMINEVIERHILDNYVNES